MTHNIHNLFQERDKEYIENFKSRYWQKVDKSDNCWKWTGGECSGYGTIWWTRSNGNGIHLRANRVAKYLEVEEDISNKEALHTCHNEGCCRPSHIKLGTGQENKQDSDCGKLNKEEILQIRNLGYKGIPQGDISDKFNVSRTHVSRIVRGEKWNNVGGLIKGLHY